MIMHLLVLLHMSSLQPGLNDGMPGFRIIDDSSAKRAVALYGDDCNKFEAVVFQAAQDKNLWRLTLVAHDNLVAKPSSPERRCNFAMVYFGSIEVGTTETVPENKKRQLDRYYKEATQCIEQSVNQLPNSAAAHITCGKYYLYHVMGFEKMPKMLAEFKKAVHLRPESGYTHYCYAEGLMGAYNFKIERVNLIIREAKKAVELDPRQVTAYFILAAAYCWDTKKDYKTSLMYLDKYLSLRPQELTNEGVTNIGKFCRAELAKVRGK